MSSQRNLKSRIVDVGPVIDLENNSLHWECRGDRGEMLHAQTPIPLWLHLPGTCSLVKSLCETLFPLASGHKANHWISLLTSSLSRSFLQPWHGHRNMGQMSCSWRKSSQELLGPFPRSLCRFGLHGTLNSLICHEISCSSRQTLLTRIILRVFRTRIEEL